MVEAAKASEGAAARMPTTPHEWAVQRPWGRKLVQAAGDKAIRCKLAIRCDAIGKEGGAFTCGIYDVENKRGVAHLAVSTQEIPDSGYHVYDLGAHKLTERMYVWVAPVKNEKNVKAVWVDRIWLVRE